MSNTNLPAPAALLQRLEDELRQVQINLSNLKVTSSNLEESWFAIIQIHKELKREAGGDRYT